MTGETQERLRPIASRQNSLVKDLRRAFTQAELTDDGYCAVEGLRILEEAIRSGLRIKAVFFSHSGQQHAERLLPQLGNHTETLLLPDEVFQNAVSTETPQGVAALVKLKNLSLQDMLRGPDLFLLGAAGIQDPGNLGTMIRSAEAFGASGILTLEKTVATINPKTIRASAGSIFRLPVVKASFETVSATLHSAGIRVVATSSHKGTPLHEADLTGPVAVIVGSEGAGVPKDVLVEADEMIVIPHSPRVESLNAGIAASIILYEAAMQRQKTQREVAE